MEETPSIQTVGMRRYNFKVRRYRDRARPRWRYIVSHYEGGKRKGKLFETLLAAKSFAKFKAMEASTMGRHHAQFPERLRITALNALTALQPYGKTIEDAVAHYVAHLQASEKSCSASQLVDELLAAKQRDGLSARHVDDLRSRLKIFTAKFDGRPVATITTAEIDDWLRSLPVSAATRNHYRSVVVQAFNFAMRRRYATANPAVDASKAREPRTKPGILTVEQATALLVNAQPGIVPYIAIGLFAGLRRAELERLDWSEIDFDSGHIEVTAEKSKSKLANRFITLQPNLRAWLMPHRKLRGNVTPPQEDFRKLFDGARESAGLLADWPDNALRHSFASYHVAHFKDAKALALEMGHIDSGMLFNHYRALVKPKEAARYWNIRPVASKKVIAFKAGR